MPNRKNNYKDMDKYKKTRSEQRRRYYNKTTWLYPKRPYTPDEDYKILNSELTDSELSSLICRSVGAIQKRRCKLKKEAG